MRKAYRHWRTGGVGGGTAAPPLKKVERYVPSYAAAIDVVLNFTDH